MRFRCTWPAPPRQPPWADEARRWARAKRARSRPPRLHGLACPRCSPSTSRRGSGVRELAARDARQPTRKRKPQRHACARATCRRVRQAARGRAQQPQPQTAARGGVRCGERARCSRRVLPPPPCAPALCARALAVHLHASGPGGGGTHPGPGGGDAASSLKASPAKPPPAPMADTPGSTLLKPANSSSIAGTSRAPR